jgi:hypothetical protein
VFYFCYFSYKLNLFEATRFIILELLFLVQKIFFSVQKRFKGNNDFFFAVADVISPFLSRLCQLTLARLKCQPPSFFFYSLETRCDFRPRWKVSQWHSVASTSVDGIEPSILGSWVDDYTTSLPMLVSIS